MLDNILEDKFLVNPIKKQDNIYYFGNSEDADCFDSNHVKSWLDGVFERRWNDKRYINNYVSKYMIENIISQELPVIDIACGPGMGLIPAIKSMRNDTVCIANDNTKDAEGKKIRKQLEVDFVVNRGNKRFYIQSALSIADPEKKEQEIASLKRIPDSFSKMVVVRDYLKPWQDENGITYIGIEQFLLDEDIMK